MLGRARGHRHDADAEHLRAVEALESLESQARAAFEERREGTGRNRELTGRSGFDGRTGVFSGVHRGLNMWYGYDLVNGDFVGRTELMAPRRERGSLAAGLVESESSMRALAEVWLVSLPTTQVMVEGEPLRVSADGRDLLVFSDQSIDESAESTAPRIELDSIADALGELDSDDAVLIDRAGVSIWTLQAAK